MKAKLINFEVFFVKQGDQFSATYDTVIAEIEQAYTDGYKCIIGLLLADGFLYKNNQQWNDLHNSIIDQAYAIGIEKIVLVPGMSYDNKINCEVIPFNFNLHTVYNSYVGKEVKPYNHRTGKFLFLGGVPDRPNRIGLLKSLYDKELLKHGEWSFFRPWTKEQEVNCKAYFSSDNEYEDFVSYAERSFDNVYETSKTYGTTPAQELNDSIIQSNVWCNDTAWIDPELFGRTSLSIVSEGHPGDTNNNSCFLTEKTYRAFVQGHPILLAANPSMFKYAKSLGFEMFEDLFPEKNYAVSSLEEFRLKKLVQNLESWLEYPTNFSLEVEHNRNLFFNIAKENKDILDKLVSIGADPIDIDFYFRRKGFGHLLRVIDGNLKE